MRYWAKKSGQTIVSVESYSHDLDVIGCVEITKAEFDAFMQAIPTFYPVDWKALWLAADTVAKKITVIAQKLNLE